MRYLSLLRYSPKVAGDLGDQCRGLVNAIKNDQSLANGTLASEAVADVLVEASKTHTGLREVFNGAASLVPIPRSAPRSPDAMWPSLRIAKAMVDHGLGAEVLVAVERFQRIRPSHTSGQNRPSVDEHIATLRHCLSLHARPNKIILVDDVITKGVTAWACKTVIQEVLPDAEIVTFAAVSTEHPDATLIGPVAIRDAFIRDNRYGPWRPDTKDPATWERP